MSEIMEIADTAKTKPVYEINGKAYRLHYSIGRLEQIEQATGCSVMTAMVSMSEKKMMPLYMLKAYFAYGLMDDSGVFAPLKSASEFAEKQIQENGYFSVMNAVTEQITEDCGFLFRVV